MNKNLIILSHLFTFIVLASLSIGGTFSAITNHINLAINRKVEYLFDASSVAVEASPCFYKNRIFVSNVDIFDKLSEALMLEESDVSGSSNDSDFSGDMNASGEAFLACYHYERYGDAVNSKDIPPTGIVLDYLQVGQTWRSPKFQVRNYDGEVVQDLNQMEEVFKGTFRVIDAKLNALVLIDENDLNRHKISNDIIPAGFRLKNFETKEFELPREAIEWIRRQQVKQQQLAIADILILLMVLGSLGSIIFLLRQHIEDPERLPVRAYIFKPIFGMLLALSSFIVGIGIDSLLSESSSSEDIKVEGLLILAFGSGLLSEQVYGFLERQVAARTGSESENQRPPENPGA